MFTTSFFQYILGEVKKTLSLVDHVRSEQARRAKLPKPKYGRGGRRKRQHRNAVKARELRKEVR